MAAKEEEKERGEERINLAVQKKMTIHKETVNKKQDEEVMGWVVVMVNE